MSQMITVVVAPDGSTRLETEGFAGRSCQDASQFLEQALGQSTHEQLTSEFYTQASTGNRIQQNSGG